MALPPASVVFPLIIETVKPAVSSLLMVVVAVAVVMVELSGAAVKLGLERVAIIVSLGSTTVSPKTFNVMVLLVSVAAKLIVPVAAVAPDVPPILL